MFKNKVKKNSNIVTMREKKSLSTVKKAEKELKRKRANVREITKDGCG